MRKHNIAIIVHQMGGTGVGRVVANLSHCLQDERYNKFIIIYGMEHVKYNLNGKVIDLNVKGRSSVFGKLFNTFKRILLVRKIKKENNIETTISFIPNPNLVNILSRKKDKIIISERSYMSENHKGINRFVYKLVYKHIYNRADEIIAVSNGVKEDLIKTFKVPRKKIRVIYNFYDTEKIKILSQMPLISNKVDLYSNSTIITAGRLDYAKGQWHLIRAFSKVKNIIPNAKLLILGEDVGYGSYLNRLSLELNLINDIHFLGFKENPFKYLSKADLFVFPSLFEGFPNGLSEAMACGLPVISSDCKSGPREILQPAMSMEYETVKDITYANYGVLVPPCDGIKYEADKKLTKEEVILSSAIIEMLENKELRESYSLLAKKRINDFHRDIIIKEWENLMK